jgi:ABC-type multidrug transport system ATPase subunit
MQKIVAVALALGAGGDLLILDEPFGGLDPIARQAVTRALLDTLQESGTSILFSSHQITEVDRLAERIVLFNSGQVVLQGEPQELVQRVKEVIARSGGSTRRLPELPGALRSWISGEERHFLLHCPSQQLLDDYAARHQCRVQLIDHSLEELFCLLCAPNR